MGTIVEYFVQLGAKNFFFLSSLQTEKNKNNNHTWKIDANSLATSLRARLLSALLGEQQHNVLHLRIKKHMKSVSF